MSVDSNFFDDLGADSMVMARFCARVRKLPDLPAVSIKDIYQHPTIKSLATALGGDAPVPVEVAAPTSVEVTAPTSVEVTAATSVKVAKPARTPQVILCGTLQLLIFLGYGFLAALLIVQGFKWISAATGVLDIYLRSLLSGCAMFLYLFTVPILAKWILIGRWKPQPIRIWSLAYLRFWVVKTLVQRNPIVLFTGSPLFTFYLRTLGAKVGRGVVIFSTHVPICTDLLTIGDGTVIQKDSFINGYRAHAGFIQVGSISIGKNAVISESTVIDIDTSMGDGTQLGRASSLHAGQAVPDSERWHGSPAQQTEADYQSVEPTKCGALRRVGYTVMQLLNLLVVSVPLGISGLIVLLQWVPQLKVLLEPGTQGVTTSAFYVHALVVSLVLFFGGLIFAFLFVMTVPRLLNLGMTPDKVYPLYGFHYALHRTIARMTNLKALTYLFGDSSYIVNYLRRLGYNFWRPIQTGSNFGQMVKHDNPYLSTIGRGTMVADGLSIINADFSSTSFCVSQVTIGPHNFLGNSIAYPAAGQDWRELPPRHEGPRSDRRESARERRTSGLTQLRDSANCRAGRFVRRSDRWGRAAQASRRQEQAQHRHHGDVPVRTLAIFLRASPSSPGPSRTSTRRSVHRSSRWPMSSSSCSASSTGSLSTVSSHCSSRCDLCSARSTTALFGDTNDSGRSRRGRGLSRSSTERRSRPRSGVCSVSGSAAGSSMTGSG